ncbi:helix-turn-helix transcriptional regulator [Bacillus sp. FSL R9-9530]|uniref:helix-turn-helix transcriptional regulator n=1 Tax=Bacillus sp. FSL R9-9530 TaxID=2921593 RepID=UPI0030FABEAE
MHKMIFLERKLRRKTIEEVADFLNVSPRTYWAKEHNKSEFTLKEAHMLSCYLEKSIEELFPDLFLNNL